MAAHSTHRGVFMSQRIERVKSKEITIGGIPMPVYYGW
jgi:hypothetical protein